MAAAVQHVVHGSVALLPAAPSQAADRLLYSGIDALWQYDLHSKSAAPLIRGPEPTTLFAVADKGNTIALIPDRPKPPIILANTAGEPVQQLVREERDFAGYAALALSTHGTFVLTVDTVRRRIKTPDEAVITIWDTRSSEVVSQTILHHVAHPTIYMRPTAQVSDADKPSDPEESLANLEWLLVADNKALYGHVEQCRDLAVIVHDTIDLKIAPRARRGTSFVRRNSLEEALDLERDLLDSPAVSIRDVTWCGDALLAGCREGELIELDLATLQPRILLNASVNGPGSADTLLWRQDLSLLYVAGSAGKLRTYVVTAASDIQLVQTYSLNHAITQLTRLNNGQTLLADRNYLALWSTDMKTPETLLAGLPERAFAVTAVAALTDADKPSQTLAVTVGALGDLAMYQADTGNFLALERLDTDEITCVAASPASPWLVLGARDGSCRFLTLAPNGQAVTTHIAKLAAGPITRAALVDEGHLLVIIHGRCLQILETATADVALSLTMPEEHLVGFSMTRLACRRRDDSLNIAVTLQRAADEKVPDNEANLSNDALLRITVPIDIHQLRHMRHKSTNPQINLNDAEPFLCSIPASSHLVWDRRSPGPILVSSAPARLTVLQAAPSIPTSGAAAPALFQWTEFQPSDITRTIDLPQTLRAVHVSSNGAVAACVLGRTLTMVPLDGTTPTVDWPLPEPAYYLEPTSVHVAFLEHTDRLAVLTRTGGLALFAANLNATLPPLDGAATARAWDTARQAKPLSADAKQSLRGPSTSGASTALTQATATILDPDSLTEGQKAIVHRLDALRGKLRELIAANVKKPDDERLGKAEFVVNRTEQDRLQREKELAIAELRAHIELEMLREQFLRNNLKKACWDTMETKGQVVVDFEGDVEVRNFPLPYVSREEAARLERVQSIRRIERAAGFSERLFDEAQADAHRAASAAAEAPAGATSSVQSPDNGPAQGDGDDDGEGATDGAPEASDDQGPKRISLFDLQADNDSLLYRPLELDCTHRRRNQTVLLQDAIRQAKLSFNKRFTDTVDAKRADVAKIEAINKKIVKICEELQSEPPLYHPPTFPHENPEHVLAVRDEEVQVPRVLTAEQRAALEEQERLEAERRRKAAENDAHDRGVYDMMFGRLESREEESVWEDLPKPAFMSEVPKSQWDDEQKKTVQAYEAAVKELMEKRDKRRQLLQAELRALQEQVEATRLAFNERVRVLFGERIASEQLVTCHELAVLKLSQALHVEREMRHRQLELVQELNEAKAVQARCARQVTSATNMVADVQLEYDAMVTEDKQLDKSFKTRRDFNGAEAFLDILYRLYRRRPKKYGLGVPVPPLVREHDCPEGLEDAMWRRLVHLREQKIASEHKVHLKAQDLAVAKQFLARREVEEREAANRVDMAISEQRSLHNDLLELSLDLPLLVTVQQGQVEVVHEDDFDPNYDDAVLVHRAFVDDLNDQTRQLAQAKIAHTRKKIESGKGLRLLEWQSEHMDLELEYIEDVSRQTQLFKVKKNSGHKTDPVKEAEHLEKVRKAREDHYEHVLADKQKQLKRLQKQLGKRVRENEQLDQQIRGMANTVAERAQVRQVQAQVVGDGGAEQRLRGVQHRRKLVELVQSQAEEMALLRREVERLRLKSFPAFGPSSGATSRR